jgi:hypothetical protein
MKRHIIYTLAAFLSNHSEIQFFGFVAHIQPFIKTPFIFTSNKSLYF